MNPVSTHTMSRLACILWTYVKRQECLDRVGSQVLGDGDGAEHHLQLLHRAAGATMK